MPSGKCSRPAKMRSALQRARAETGAEQRGVGNEACGEGGLACIEACAGSGPVPCLQRLRFSHWREMWPGLNRDFFDAVTQQCGLAITWGLMHADELMDTEDPVESKTEFEARHARDEAREAYTKQWARDRVREHLAKEPKGRHPRQWRSCSLNWGTSKQAIYDAFREMGECVCLFPPLVPWSGECEMCLGEV